MATREKLLRIHTENSKHGRSEPYSIVRVRNGQWMYERTAYLGEHPEYRYYERVDLPTK